MTYSLTNPETPAVEKYVRALAVFQTTMERNTFPKDHLLDTIIRQCRQWAERREEERQANLEEIPYEPRAREETT